MRVLLFAIITLIFAQQSFSQKELNLSTYDTILSRNLITNSDVKAKVYAFEDRISVFRVDSITNTSTITLRNLTKNKKRLKNKGKILTLDFENNKILWNKRFLFNYDNVYIFDSLLIYYEQNNIELWSIRNGKKVWDEKLNLHYLIPSKKIALAYYNAQAPKYLQAIDLTNGNTLWERKLNKDNGWEEVQSLNDSIYLIYSNGLHTLNINDGSGLSVDAKTDDKDYTGTVVASAAGLALGILTGTYYIPISGPSVVDNIRSNALIDSSYIFFASRNNLSKMIGDSLTLWEVEMQKKDISHSSLFKKDSILYMINYGYAKNNGRKIAYGKPFLKAYSANTGNLIYSIMPEGESILEYKINGDKIIFLYDNGISQYSLIDGSFVSNRKFDTKSFGNITAFVGDNIYYNNSSIYQPFVSEDKTNYCIFFSTGYVKLLNSRFETIEEKDYNKLFFLDSKYGGYGLLSSDTTTLLINSEGEAILRLTNFSNASFSKGKLYGINDNKLLEIDLSQLGIRENEIIGIKE